MGLLRVYNQHLSLTTPASEEDAVDQHDLERIARATLRELGLAAPDLTITAVTGQPGTWRLDIREHGQAPTMIQVKCGSGSTAGWVREQIFQQFTET
jgi:hypothetical protein